MNAVGPDVEPRILVVILNWNGLADTISCLRTLQESTYSNVKILVVDNGSFTDEAESIRKAYGGYVDVVRLEQNTGFANGSNIGLLAALSGPYKYVLLLNNDTQVDSEAIQELVRAAELNPDGGAYGPLIVGYGVNARTPLAGGRILVWRGTSVSHTEDLVKLKEKDEPFTTGWLSGAALLLRTAMIREIGILDSVYFSYMEDTDLELRMLMRGWLLYCVPTALIYHRVASSTDFFSRIRVNSWARNRLILVSRFGTVGDVLAFSVLFFAWVIPTHFMLGILLGSGRITIHDVPRFACSVLRGVAGGVVEIIRR